MKFKMVHENYNVSDLDVSLAFYKRALGLTEIRRLLWYSSIADKNTADHIAD